MINCNTDTNEFDYTNQMTAFQYVFNDATCNFSINIVRLTFWTRQTVGEILAVLVGVVCGNRALLHCVIVWTVMTRLAWLWNNPTYILRTLLFQTGRGCNTKLYIEVL